MAFETLDDAKRVMDVLGKRLARYGLALHPSKTQLVDFRFHRPGGVRHPDTDSATFDFLGFSHIWAKSKKGVNGVRQVTAKGRYARALAAVSDWCRQNRHRSLRDQPVPDVARPLCLLRYIWQLSTHTMVCLPDRGAVEEMAGSAASWRRRVPLDPPQRDSQAPPASPGADPGSQAIHPIPLPRSKTPAGPTIPHPDGVVDAAPAQPTAKAPAIIISRLFTRLRHLLPTLHDGRCRTPCKARFRLVG